MIRSTGGSAACIVANAETAVARLEHTIAEASQRALSKLLRTIASSSTMRIVAPGAATAEGAAAGEAETLGAG